MRHTPAEDAARRQAGALVAAGILTLMAGSLGLAKWCEGHPAPACPAPGWRRSLDGPPGECLHPRASRRAPSADLVGPGAG